MRTGLRGASHERYILLFAVVLLVGPIVGLGVLTTTDIEPNLQTEHALPAPYMDRQDQHAMERVKQYTVASAQFVALGDAAELFPFVTDRTTLISPWSAEWEGTRAMRVLPPRSALRTVLPT